MFECRLFSMIGMSCASWHENSHDRIDAAIWQPEENDRIWWNVESLWAFGTNLNMWITFACIETGTRNERHATQPQENRDRARTEPRTVRWKIIRGGKQARVNRIKIAYDPFELNHRIYPRTSFHENRFLFLLPRTTKNADPCGDRCTRLCSYTLGCRQLMSVMKKKM